jgi:glyoxylase-like metal-dependent hydrolase (beta-lactamase superfamily II)
MKFVLFFVGVLLCAFIAQATTHIKGYSAGEDSEGLPKQYLVWDDDDTYILFDTGDGSSTDGLIDFIEENGATKLRAIFITAPNREQYGGVPALYDEFPGTLVTVTNYNIYDALLESVGVASTDGFVWAQDVRVLSDDDTLDEVEMVYYDDFLPSFEPYYTIFGSHVYNWAITGDALYVQHHPYLGLPLDQTLLQNWYNGPLAALQEGGRLGFDKNTVFYAAHGRTANQGSVAEFILYLQDFENRLTFCVGDKFRPSLDDIRDDLIIDYPTWVDTEILDAMVDNPNWETLQESSPLCPYYITPGMYSYSVYGSPASILSVSVMVLFGAFLCFF